MMPIYTGHTGESDYTIPVGTENFWSINSKASKADINASIDFINWMFTNETAKQKVSSDLGFIAPFTNFTSSDMPTNPLAQEVLRLSNISGKKVIPWVFDSFPSQDWKNSFGGDLLDYTQGTMTWAALVTDVQDNWAAAKANN